MPRARLLQFTIPALVACLCSATIAFAQQRFEDLPGHDRYVEVRDAMSSLATGGTISRLNWSADGAALFYTRSGQRYRVMLETGAIEEWNGPEPEAEGGDGAASNRRPRARPRRGHQRDAEESPDGRWTAECRDWNVVLIDNETDEEIAVTTGGSRRFRFGKASWVYGEELSQSSAMFWSPDSTMLAFYEFDERKVPEYHLTGDLTKLRTTVLTEGYPKPGDPNPIAKLRVYTIDTGETTSIDVGDASDQYVYQVRFSPDGGELLFNRTNRHQNVLDLVAADPRSGASRVVLTETQDTWQDNRPTMRFLSDGRRFIWRTERNRFAQYELWDISGQKLAVLTSPDHPVDSIIEIDEDAGVLFYTAYGPDHPLARHFFRVNLDGTGRTQLTHDSGRRHSPRLSPDNRWFITRYEAADAPPATALYSAKGERIATLAESETSKMKELGLRTPELFSYRAADGETVLYGTLWFPSNFDASRKYPLLIDVYGGPHSQTISNRWRAAYPQTEFGCIIAKLENRGTMQRGKDFESATYLQLGVVDLDDQVAGVRHLMDRPYIDNRRIGIFGHSYGGYMSALAILRYPEIFAAAAAGGTVSDWRNYDTIYTERYMRTPEENPKGYDAGSCMTYAANLTGRLLLTHGMVDDNVHPTNMWQLADALHEADKPFEMYLFPDHGHSLGRAGSRVRWVFLYNALLGDE